MFSLHARLETSLSVCVYVSVFLFFFPLSKRLPDDRVSGAHVLFCGGNISVAEFIE